ncbi:MAG: SDR family oxidoreductase, partial [Alphaproteobacteria bacterium]
AQVMRRTGRIDILVNNAGFFNVARRPFWEIDLAEWDRIVSINIHTVFLCARAAAQPMRAQKSGRIVNISSNVVTFGMPNLMHYVAAKAAVVGMTRAMASELGPFGITVNAVAPGLVATPAARQSASQAIFDHALDKQRLKHVLTPDDVAAAVSCFCLPESRSITGQTLLVNGGDGFGGV